MNGCMVGNHPIKHKMVLHNTSVLIWYTTGTSSQKETTVYLSDRWVNLLFFLREDRVAQSLFLCFVVCGEFIDLCHLFLAHLIFFNLLWWNLWISAISFIWSSLVIPWCSPNHVRVNVDFNSDNLLLEL